jgi:uncharacterized protein (TIGR02145 family)
MIKKCNLLVYPMTIMVALLLLTYSCKQDNSPSNAIIDVDGNVYHSVSIGTQVWMVENLKVTKYRNGDPIPNVKFGLAWSILTSGAYCDYGDSASYSKTYGKLYNWYTVNDSRNIAPVGWHVPSYAEWTTLINYLGGNDVAGGKLKEKGLIHWMDPNKGATNESGFTALPCGKRVEFDMGVNAIGIWWAASEYDADNGYYRYVSYNEIKMGDFSTCGAKYFGLAVRCLKDY